MQELIDLEQRGWRSLATPGDAGKEFYSSILSDDAVMLFPGGMQLLGRDRILESLAAQPWDSYRLENFVVVQLNNTAATVTYNSVAQRKGSEPYAALISSTYVLEDSWKLVVHQQSPA